MKMKRFLAVFAIIAVLCTFCTVAAMAYGEDTPPEGYKYLTFVITGDAGSETFTHLVVGEPIEVKEATCTEGGYERYLCAEKDCEAEGLWHQVNTEALGHEWSTDPEGAEYWGYVGETPTCEHGGTAYEYCTRCGELKEVRELQPLDHDYEEVVDTNTCKEYKSHYECKDCGAVLTDEKGNTIYNTERPEDDNPSDHHTWSKWKLETEATCEHEGKQSRVCSTCGAKQYETIKMSDHQWVVSHTHLLDCTKIEVTYECANCGMESPEKTIIEGNFHQYVAAEQHKNNKAATCLEDGAVQMVCKYCGDEGKVEKVPALGHDWSDWELIDTYNTEDGEELGVYTRDCQRPNCDYHEELVSATSPVEEPENPGASEEPEAPVETVENIYAIDAANVVKGDASVSGTGNLIVVGTEEVGEMYVRVAVVYENEAGEQILVVNVAEVKADLTFKIPSVKAPYGYSVKTVCLVAVTSDEAVEGAWADYAVCDNVVL